MLVTHFHYTLPADLIAQEPSPQRDQSRLMVLRRPDGTQAHHIFGDLPTFLRAGDLLVLNDTRVIRARLHGHKMGGHGRVEVLLGEETAPNDWWVMLRPGKRVRVGTRLAFPRPNAPLIHAVVGEKDPAGLCRLIFKGVDNIQSLLDEIGEVPLPPYIERPDHPDWTRDIERYQTVYAASPGAVAAPTAGLHFTPALLRCLERQGIELCRVTLHVGLGTFAPIKTVKVEDHVMHAERYALSRTAADQLNRARAAGRRVIAVGTTCVRLLEHAMAGDRFTAGVGQTRLFITPPHRFRAVDAMITNFHLPESTLLMLVSAFADPGGMRGRDLILKAYAEAIRHRYRFFSYGDAMLIL
jgi:S-adenosylmethionine:tRNA ribosyltransferase-isomerase